MYTHLKIGYNAKEQPRGILIGLARSSCINIEESPLGLCCHFLQLIFVELRRWMQLDISSREHKEKH